MELMMCIIDSLRLFLFELVEMLLWEFVMIELFHLFVTLIFDCKFNTFLYLFCLSQILFLNYYYFHMNIWCYLGVYMQLHENLQYSHDYSWGLLFRIMAWVSPVSKTLKSGILNGSRLSIVKNSSYFWFYVTFLKLGIYNLNRI